jgi:hypothetical protein
MELRQITEITSNIWFDTRLVKRPSLYCEGWSHLDEFRLGHVSIRIPASCKSYISPTQASSIQGNTGDRKTLDLHFPLHSMTSLECQTPETTHP